VAVGVVVDDKIKSRNMNENIDKLEPAKCYIKEVNNNKEGQGPNCALNVTIFEDQYYRMTKSHLKGNIC
jgi:hypothetical protein